MQFRRRPRHAARASEPSPADSPPASRSAAWLAGERLFAAPARADEPAAPVMVTVRRSKLATAVSEGEGAVPETDSPEWKGPRVFRVQAASNETLAETEAPAPEVVPIKRAPRGRIGVDRRPGPVAVQVFQTEPAAVEPQLPLPEQLAVLNRLMSEVSGILAEAQRARAWRC